MVCFQSDRVLVLKRRNVELKISSGFIRNFLAFGNFDDKFLDECRDIFIADDCSANSLTSNARLSMMNVQVAFDFRLAG